MKNSLFLLFIFLNFWLSASQNLTSEKEAKLIESLIQKGDSLKKKNSSEAMLIFKKGLAIALDHKSFKQAAVIYKKIGVLHHRNKDYLKALEIYKRGIRLDSTSAVGADLYYNLSLIKERLNQQDSVLFFLERSLKLYEQFALNNSAYKAFLKGAIVYKDRQFYDKALTYAVKAYSGFKQEKNKKKLADVSIIIGNIQKQLKNYHQALVYHLEALGLSKDIKNELRQGICYTNIANVYEDLKNPDSAIINYKKALNYFSENNTQKAVLLGNLAIAYKSIGAMGLAKKHFRTSIKLNQRLKDTTALLYNFNGLASMYIEHNDLEKVTPYLDSIKSYLPSVSDKHIALNFYENQAEYHQKSNNYKTALEYQLKYSNLYKDIYGLEQAKIVQTLQTKFDYERKENEILKLNLENKSAQLQLTEKNESIKTKNLVVIILVIITLLLSLMYYVFLQKQRTTIQNAKIERLEAIYQGQETIKKRIARDLHDIITTNFDGLRLRILALKRSKKVDDTVDEITEELKKMNQQIRIVSHRLYPLEMYMNNQKFTSIIKSRLSEFQLYGNVFVELENQLPEMLNKLSLVVQNNFYGILLEVLNNVTKHALATKIKIDNYKDNKGHLHFVFEDNGIGIKQNHKEGIGLLNIKQRVEIIEGSCTINKTESGTCVHIKFPID